jgi:hypothetical protein
MSRVIGEVIRQVVRQVHQRAIGEDRPKRTTTFARDPDHRRAFRGIRFRTV